MRAVNSGAGVSALLMAVIVCLCGCASPAQADDARTIDGGLPSGLVASLVRLTGNGGRVDWYSGGDEDLIAFDATTARGKTDLFTMKPDGSDRRCVTCAIEALPEGFRGQPAWHPDGRHLIIQAQGKHSHNGLFNHMAWGINNDLWLISLDGTRAELIWLSPENHGALHPHFSRDGRMLMFSERQATGEVIAPLAKRFGAGGENQWTGWRIALADVDLSATGQNILGNVRRLFERRPGFYESHGFGPDGEIVFSHTAGGRPYVDDIYSARSGDAAWETLIRSPRTWDEHGSFSPSGRALAFVSSRADPTWRAPGSRAETLTLELYLRTADSRVHQLTNFNTDPDRRILVSDFDWDGEGRRIVLQVAPMDAETPALPEIWLLEFNQPQ